MLCPLNVPVQGTGDGECFVSIPLLQGGVNLIARNLGLMSCLSNETNHSFHSRLTGIQLPGSLEAGDREVPVALAERLRASGHGVPVLPSD